MFVCTECSETYSGFIEFWNGVRFGWHLAKEHPETWESVMDSENPREKMQEFQQL